MRTVVIGGGVAGLLAARLARDRGDDVTLIEQSDRVGGLLGTAHHHDGLAFDYGTHFVADTGRGELDALLFPPDDDQLRPIEDGLRAANVFAGALDDASVAIDTNRLPPDVRDAGVADLLRAEPDPGAGNALDALVSRFGATFTREVFVPVLGALLGVDDLGTVAPGIERLFDLNRIKILTPTATNELKTIARLDAAIAFHDRTQGRNVATVRYPRHGGIGVWTDRLAAELRDDGVEIVVNGSIERLVAGTAGVQEVVCAHGSVVCDRVIWSVSPVPLAMQLGVPISGTPPRLRITTLAHLVFDRPFPTDAHYVNLYDPDIAGFRVTLYPNAGADTTAGHHCTVEFLDDAPAAVDVAGLTVELQRVGIVSPGAALIHSHTHVAGAGFPVPTPTSEAALASIARAALDVAPNVTIVGRGSGRAFFMSDVLVDTYDQLLAHDR